MPERGVSPFAAGRGLDPGLFFSQGRGLRSLLRYPTLVAPDRARGGVVGRPLLTVAVVLLLAVVLGATGLLDDVADIVVQILRILFDLLVALINLFVRLIEMLVGWLRSVG
jgi:UDP-N-acetylmuramyl pentapeptide phosphotransferase/UDP-N-acetylglucosamine-1-phosphate transferase